MRSSLPLTDNDVYVNSKYWLTRRVKLKDAHP